MKAAGLPGRIEAMLTMAMDLNRGAYPSLVYDRTPADGELPPILTFHATTARALESVLVRLSAAGYRTWTCDEYLAAVRGETPATPCRSVLLTFDDGYASVWSEVYPLLRRFNMRAVVFLIPGRIQDGRDTSATRGPLCTWPQIREMHESGLLDFQSHTLLHHRVFVDTTLQDFVRPQLLRASHPHDLLLWNMPVPGRESLPIEPSYPPAPLGAPIYRNRPRMVADRAVLENEDVRQACTALVREGGGARFFTRPDWRRRLRSVVRTGREVTKEPIFEPADRQERDILSDLKTARQMIEERLPGKRVRHLAWPWGVAGEVALRAADVAGYEACYWGRVEGRLSNSVGSDPMRLARIGEDFVRCLPGADRLGLPRLLLDKLLRRTSATAGRSDGTNS